MTEVGHADLSRLLQSKRNECSAIVTSRKRKLRELFAVATQPEGLPEDAFANPDAPAATAAEWQFLQASDVLQGKQLNEANIPPRPKISLDCLKRSLARSINVLRDEVTPSVTTAQSLKKAAPTPKIESPPSKSPPLPSVDAARTSTASNTIAAKPSSQTPLHALQPASGPAGGTSTPLLPTTSTISTPTNDVAQRRPTQVSFPPGTKGSPSTEAAKIVAGTAAGIAAATAATQGVATTNETTDPANQQTNRDGQALVKPFDTSKASEAASSPGSTAPSATTPAVDDASTDTSPDNDGQHYMDDNEQHLTDAQTKDSEEAEAVESGEHTSGAEDQLLQESIRSSAAVTSPEQDKTSDVAPEAGKDALNNTTATKDATPSANDTLQPTPAAEGPQQSAPVAVSQPPLAEVPDSQGDSPDNMDVDAPEPSSNTQPPTVLSSREPNLPTHHAPTIPTHHAPTTPLSTKAAPKELSKAAERAVTRVSSGAMRLKSVTEIVGGTPRPHNPMDRSTSKGSQEQLTPVTSTPQSPASRHRQISSKKDKKNQVSTVLFGKHPKRNDDKAIVPGQKETFQPSDDYYTPLFVQNFTGATNWMQPIEKVLFHANKTIATPDAHLAIRDHQACKVLRRVYHLQQHDKWSLRQPKRCPEPTRQPSQWDVLLQEAKWMRTDFREERKWKMSVARNMAYACAEWLVSSPEERQAMQVLAVIPPKPNAAEDESMADVEDGAESHPTPDLVSSGDVDSPQNIDELADDFPETVAPSAIFTLQEDDVVFKLRRTPASDQLLEELPMYGSPLQVPKFDIMGSEYDPDAHWRRPALPLSKYVEGRMNLLSEGPPRKRSRFHYENEDSDDEKDGDFVADQFVHHVQLPPGTDEVALFNPETKHIRDRLHAGHQFRPPSEHPMPTQSFYECRSSSQWTMVEDDELRGLVREYSYNWSLISNMLSTKSLFISGAERRTPWECFERWINLEGLPSDMQKTQYFKAYNTRIEAAQRVIAQQNQLAAQQASASGGAVAPIRRRPSTPLRVERRRNQKHLTLIDAMRKLAKKRETTLQKQQHNATQNAAIKKTTDAASRGPIKTPRDYSLLRWERDQALAEKMAQYAQRQEAQRRAAIQARAQGHAAQIPGQGQIAGAAAVVAAAAAAVAAQGGQNGNHAGAGNGINGVNGANRPGIPNQLAAAAAAAARQGQARMPMQVPANGMTSLPSQMNGNLVPSAQMNGAPQAQMQAMQGQHRMPMPNTQADANVMLRAQRISEQQRAAVQMQAQQQQQQGNAVLAGQVGQQGSPPMRNGVNSVNQQNFMNNAQAMMAQFNATNGNGHASSPLNGLHAPSIPNGASPGPRVQPQIPPGIASQLAQLEAQFRAKNPNITPEQARQLATEHLTRLMMAQRQSAMNAAAGGSGQPGLANGIAATTSPHQYAALLRQQQQQQAAQQAAQLAAQQQAAQQQAAQQQAAQQQAAQQQAAQATQAAGSPGQAQQRQSSGSATPSTGK